MYRNKLLVLVSLVVVASMFLAACQPQTVEVVKTVVVTQEVMVEGTPQVQEVVVTATTQPTEAPTEPPPAQPADTIVLALQQEPDTLHPLIGSMMSRTIVMGAALIGCMAQDETAAWVPLGCDTVPTLENGGAVWVGEGADKHLEVSYKIRDGWRWTDGTPVTTKDVVYGWKLVMDPAMEVAGRSTTEKVFDVVAKDDQNYTVVYMSEAQAKAAAAGTLEGNVPFKDFQADYDESGYANQAGPVVDPVYFANTMTWLPSHVLESVPAAEQATVDWTQTPVDGPYVIKEWKQGQEIVMEKSDQPFPLGDPAIKTVIFRFFAETAAVIAALQNGEVDIVTGTGGLSVASAPDLDKIEAAGLYKMIYEPGYQWEHIDLNTTTFPFDDVKVRQALYYATDKQSLVDKLYFGKQKATDLPVPQGLSWAYTDNYTKYPFDPEKAKATLVEAGWNCDAAPCSKEIDGQTKVLEFTLMTTDRADRQAVAQVLQQQWKAAGFGVNLQFLYGRGLFAPCSQNGPLYCRTFQAAMYTWITGDDPGFIGLYDCANIPTEENEWSGQNNPGWCNADADVALQKNEMDPEISLSRELRKPELEKFFQIWTAEVPVIPLFSNTRVYAARVGLEGYRPGPTNASPDTWNIWEWKLSK